jgi:hypothetical protein
MVSLPIPNAIRSPSPAARAALIGGVVALGLCGAPAGAGAQLACGAVIAAGQKVTLTADVGPCSQAAIPGSPAVRIIGPATLNLNGFAVLCDPADRPDGITIDGAGAKLLNGTVRNCANGVEVAGAGGHAVTSVTSRLNSVTGFVVSSDKNKLTGNDAVENADDGFHTLGGSLGNQLVHGTAAGNGDDGFLVDGSDHKVTQNASTQNGGDGFQTVSGSGTGVQFSQNVATFNARNGFIIFGSGHKLQANRSVANGDGDLIDDGFRIAGPGHQLKKNRAVANDGRGIRLDPAAQGTLVQQNVAQENGGNDLEDDAADCDANQWKKNVFRTRDPAGCVQ